MYYCVGKWDLNVCRIVVGMSYHVVLSNITCVFVLGMLLYSLLNLFLGIPLHLSYFIIARDYFSVVYMHIYGPVHIVLKKKCYVIRNYIYFIYGQGIHITVCVSVFCLTWRDISLINHSKKMRIKGNMLNNLSEVGTFGPFFWTSFLEALFLLDNFLEVPLKICLVLQTISQKKLSIKFYNYTNC